MGASLAPPEYTNEKGITVTQNILILYWAVLTLQLPLTYAVYSWSEHYKCALMQKYLRISKYFHFLDIKTPLIHLVNPQLFFEIFLQSLFTHPGLVAPLVAQKLMGQTGEILMLLLLLMAVTSTGSAEVIAVTSILVYDIYQLYLKVSDT